ncbi:MAG: DMT family transporter [Alphaproteobacteria bacterium]
MSAALSPAASPLVRLAPFAFIALWSTSFITARVGLQHVSPLYFVTLRLLGATLLLLLLCAITRASWVSLRGRWWRLALAGALLNGVALAAFHVAMVTVNAAVIALLQSLNPLIIALLAVPMLGERLGWKAWVGLVLGAVGVAIVVAPKALGTEAEVEAMVLGAIGIAGLAGGTLLYGQHGRGVALLPATTVQLGAAAVLGMVLTALFETPVSDNSAVAWITIGWNIVAVSVGGMALYYFMLNRGAAGRVAANFYLVPGVVGIAGWLLLGEALAPLAVAGLVLASIGVFLVARR